MSTHHGILLHVIFLTKFRKPYLIDEWRDDLLAYIGGILKDHKSTLLKAGGIEDHVHLLLRIHSEFAISKTVQLLKANSSKWINEQRKHHTKHTFADEYIGLLNKHGIDYDPQYVFETEIVA